MLYVFNMKKRFLIILGLLGCVSSTSLFAQGDKYNPRRGFMIGFGLGGGGMSLHQNGSSLNKGAGVGEFRIGGGLNENLILMGESMVFATRDNGVDISVSNLLFSAQYFLVEGFYVRPGIGIGVGRSTSSSGGFSVTQETDAGFSM